MPPSRQICPPEHLTADHDLSQFQNGKHPSLDEWLRERALACEGLSARTYVVCDAAARTRVIGYYALSTAMEERRALPTAKLRRSMPEQVPLLLISRLALDATCQGYGVGTELLSDALRRCQITSEIIGARAVIAHAIDDAAMQFYSHHGFLLSPLGERVMLMPIEVVRRLFAD